MSDFLSPAFYGPFLFGFAGLLAWLLKSFSPAGSDSLWLALKAVFGGHSLSTTLSAIGYVGACVCLREIGQLNYFAAFGAGFMGQSFTAEFLKRRAEAKLNGGGNGH